MKTLIPKRRNLLSGLIAVSISMTYADTVLKDLVLTGGKVPTLRLVFASGKVNEDFPLFFQKADIQAGTITLCFLETPSELPLGKLTLDGATPGIDGLALKRVTTPSGKNFLGVELDFAGPAPEQVDVNPEGSHVLRIPLPGTAPSKFKWVASKTKVSQEPKPEPPKTASRPTPKPAVNTEPTQKSEQEATKNQVESSTPTLSTAKPTAEKPATLPTPTPASVNDNQAKLIDLNLVAGTVQEDLIFKLEGLFSGMQFSIPANDSTLYELRMAGVMNGMKKNIISPPLESNFKRISIRVFKDTLIAQIQLRMKAALQAGSILGGISITSAHTSTSPLTWMASSNETKQAPPPVTEKLPSAVAAGENLEKSRSIALSSSRVFLPTGKGKPLLILKDNAVLLEAPSRKAKVLKTLSAGLSVQGLGHEGSWFKATTTEGDTGYLRRDAAVYVDESTPSQMKTLDRLMAAKEKAAEKERQLAQQKAEALAKKEGDAKAVAATEKTTDSLNKTAEPATPSMGKGMTGESKTVGIPLKAEEPQVASTPEPKASPTVSSGVIPTVKPAKGSLESPTTVKGTSTGGAQLNLPSASDEQVLANSQDPAMRAQLDSERAMAEKDKLKGTETEERVTYNSYGRRDPFIPVDQGAADNGIDIDQMKVVGIVWQAQDPMAALQHVKEASVSYMVKQGDPVHNGRVSRITRDAVTFDITEYGISRSYTLKLVTSQERAKK